MHIESINDENLGLGLDHDQRNRERYRKPEKRGGVQDAE